MWNILMVGGAGVIILAMAAYVLVWKSESPEQKLLNEVLLDAEQCSFTEVVLALGHSKEFCKGLLFSLHVRERIQLVLPKNRIFLRNVFVEGSRRPVVNRETIQFYHYRLPDDAVQKQYGPEGRKLMSA